MVNQGFVAFCPQIIIPKSFGRKKNVEVIQSMLLLVMNYPSTCTLCHLSHIFFPDITGEEISIIFSPNYSRVKCIWLPFFLSIIGPNYFPFSSIFFFSAGSNQSEIKYFSQCMLSAPPILLLVKMIIFLSCVTIHVRLIYMFQFWWILKILHLIFSSERVHKSAY